MEDIYRQMFENIRVRQCDRSYLRKDGIFQIALGFREFQI